MRRWDSLLVVTALVFGCIACGSDRTGGPRGTPQSVLAAAADHTDTAGGASFDASAPDAERTGRVAFDTAGSITGSTSARNTAGHPELVDPRSVVDLVRGAIAPVSYGGAAVRGTSTFRYEVVINVDRALAETPVARRPAMEAFAAALGSSAFYADVWIDGAGRLRRLQVPVTKTTKRPPDRSTVLPRLVTVDFFDFHA